MVSIGLDSNYSSISRYTREELLKGLMLINIDQVTILSVFKVKETVFAFLASGIAMFNISFFSSFIAIHFSKKFGISEY